MHAPAFTSESRLMLVAAHPDDETLACSVILQRAVRAGAAIQVVYATDGDNNPWPQRLLGRKWRLDAADRIRWGKLRRKEALAALQILSVHPSNARFLALPDQRLTELLTTDRGSILQRFATCISTWAPTDIFVPSLHDTHPDHNALAVMLRLVLAKLYSGKTSASVWAYAVHGKSKAFFGHAQKLRSSKAEISVKEQAIRCHKTQLKLSRRRFLAYAPRPECFVKLQPRESSVVDGAVRRISRQSDILLLKVMLSVKPMRLTRATLFVLGSDVTGRVRCLRMLVPAHSSAVQVFDCSTSARIHLAQYHGDAFTGELAIPLDIFSPAHAIFVKFERRLWFFDEAGWLETRPVTAASMVTRIHGKRCIKAEVLS